ncbi:MAG TPA: hypothetical protein VKV16_08780 [Solirubrobacteraceae bacterium]|nr:hypothetical protein [Solirubrobacteraceae bacterium]
MPAADTSPSPSPSSFSRASARSARPRIVPLREVRELYRKHFEDRRKERQLLSTASFFVTFAGVRAITHAIRAERGPFKNITPGGRHIHHMTFGIIGLLSVGYLWLLEIGIDDRRRASRATSVAYGAGSALTLDEFALWLNLADDYWTKQGRESIDAVVLFGSLLSASVIGREFLAELVKHASSRPAQPHAFNGASAAPR